MLQQGHFGSREIKDHLGVLSGSKASVRTAVTMLVGALTMMLASKLYIPVKPVPFTGQTMGVLFIALTMTPLRAFGSLLAWIGLGALGLPVFASHVVATAALAGPTAGYIFAMLFSATLGAWLNHRVSPIVVHWLHNRWGLSCGRSLLAVCIMIGLLGDTLILSIGWAYLSSFIGSYQAWLMGVKPFLLWDALKIFTTSLIVVSGGLQKSLSR